MGRIRIGFWILAISLIMPAGGASAAAAAKKRVSADPGALIRLNMSSTVGVLLDEIPAGPLREQAAAEALAQPASFWTDRATRQAGLTYYRLIFRQFFYPGAWSADPNKKGPLPLPPRETWTVSLSGSARRASIQGHDLVVRDYDFSTHILTDASSPGVVEPRLGVLGGTWDESFTLPADPELLFERTGYACMDEDEYPPGSVFEENTHYFYDDTCHVETENTRSCHISALPKESCAVSLSRHVGSVKTGIRFTRVPWSSAIADSVRVGTTTNPDGADLTVVTDAMQEEHRILYRYFPAGSCELEEGVIAQPGWRRLLAFSAVARNDGTERIHIGDVTDPANPWVTSRVFQFSPCHGHYHFTFYGDFGYNGAPGSKRAFCLEDTNRFHNDEATPLTAEHQSCAFQGIGAGWGDEYEFGIPGQWVDITDVETPAFRNLTFQVNPQQFLCEGKPVLDALGNPIFLPSGFFDEGGFPILRMECDFFPAWNANNLGAVSVSSPPGWSFVTEACTRGQTGPLRSCGFRNVPPLRSAAAGSTVGLSCTTSGAAQVLRVCERSQALGVGVACTLADSVANVVILPSGPTSFSFQSPAVRDAAPGVGGFSLYQAPVLPSQAFSPVACTAF